MMIFWWLFGLLLVVLLIGWLVPVKTWSKASDPPAEEILRRRYARGEIDRETYDRLLADLHRPDAGHGAAAS